VKKFVKRVWQSDSGEQKNLSGVKRLTVTKQSEFKLIRLLKSKIKLIRLVIM
jgi:hypothetical protein